MASDVRKQWLAKSSQMIQDAPNVQLLSGMEAWFTLPGPLKSPPRYKMATLTWVAVYVLLNTLTYVLTPLISVYPAFVGQLLISLLMVVLLTYVVMPRITRIFYKWLDQK